jgi:hypothetical protein
VDFGQNVQGVATVDRSNLISVVDQGASEIDSMLKDMI